MSIIKRIFTRTTYDICFEHLDDNNALLIVPVPVGTTDCYLRPMPELRLSCNVDRGSESIDLGIFAEDMFKENITANIVKLIGSYVIIHFKKNKI